MSPISYLVGLERRSRNTYRAERFAAHRDLRKNMGVLVELAETLLAAPIDCVHPASPDGYLVIITLMLEHGLLAGSRVEQVVRLGDF